MNFNPFSKADDTVLAALPGTLLSGLFLYFLLSFLLIPFSVAFPISAITSIIIFGLIRYYVNSKDKQIEINTNRQEKQEITLGRHNGKDNNNLKLKKIVIFLLIYTTSIFVTAFFSDINKELFISWNEFHAIDLLKLGAAIGLSFFLPGYAVVSTLSGQSRIGLPAKVLLSYLVSMLISGMIGYILTFLGFSIWNIKLTLIGVYLVLIIPYIGQNFKILKNAVYHFFDKRITSFQFKLSDSNDKTTILYTEKIIPEILVAIGILSWVVLTSYYLYNGTIIGDQWFHHGRSLNFISGSFDELATYGLDEPYPPFLSALLASFFSLSGVPTVNAYVSINFLNVMPILAFYYFFTSWVRNDNKKAALMACSLFMLSSGFGWAEVVHVALTNPPVSSQLSSLEVLDEVGRKTFDIRLPNTFINVGNPEGTTALPIIALPAGFTLLGLMKEKIPSSKVKHIAILAGISTLGILSHDEFFLFIITACIVPLIFQLNSKKNHHSSIYISILLAISITILVDSLYPVKYYSSREIFGIPLLYLVSSFVILSWALDIIVHLHLLSAYKDSVKKKLRKFRLGFYPDNKIKNVLAISFVGVSAFLYIFTFIVWGMLSLDQIYDHSTLQSRGQKIIPWYLYPMKLGVSGLLGFAFILSYIFKRFEKELFVFGLLAIIALFTGPYYDEHRFSKYIIASMAAYASLLVYKIITSIKSPGSIPVIRGILIGLVITSSSLSILMYHGYSALGLENPSFSPFYRIMGTRFFPSEQDLSLHRFLYNNLTLDPSRDYFAIPANEYGEHSGLKAQLLGFSGISNTKLWQSPLTLNASTLEGLYYLIGRSDVRYIILPNNSLFDNAQLNTELRGPVSFALENFQKVYENKGYTVISVPLLSPPSATGDISIVYPKNDLISEVSYKNTLSFDKSTFKKIGADFVKINYENTKNKTAILKDSNKKNTLWSDNVPENVNYIEARFQIIEDKEEEEETSRRDNAGIVWDDGQKEYYLSANKDSITLEEKSSINQTDRQSLSQHLEIKRDTEWYSAKIVALQDTIDIYINEILAIQSPRDPLENVSISKIGIRSFKTEAEFEPIKIGHISQPCKDCLQKQTYYQEYYPMSMFALSQKEYDTFSQGDLSAFSKKNVMLTSDSLGIKNEDEIYMKFVKAGGTLIVIDIDNNHKGMFERLFSIEPKKKVEFDGIMRAGPESIPVSGVATDIQLADTENLTAKAFYSKNNKPVAPFVIEKNYKNGGRVIYVSAEGYFDAISKYPKRFFLTLAEMPEIIGIQADTHAKQDVPDILPAIRFTGDLKIVGDSSVNASSLSFPANTEVPYGVYAEDAYISYAGNDSSSNSTNDQKPNKAHFKNVIIRDLKLYGEYEATIHSFGVLYLPIMSSAKPDYVAASLPTGSNISINIGKGGGADFFVVGNSSQPIRILDYGKIQFQGVKSNEHSLSPVSVLMKRPYINATGSASFKSIVSEDIATLSNEIKEVNGTLALKFNHIDQNDENTRRGAKLQYVSYLEDISVKEGKDSTTDKLIKLPGDVSESLKAGENEVPWQQAITSSTSLVVLIMMVAIAAISFRFVSKGREIGGR